MPTLRERAVVLVGGLDTTGRAGLLRDAKAVHGHFLRPAPVATCIAVQTPTHVREVMPVPASAVEAQLRAAFDSYEVVAVKIGLVPTSALAEELAGVLSRCAAPIVLDPVLAASSGGALVRDGPEAVRPLLPLATLVTPNAPEAAALAEMAVASHEEAREAALRILSLGPRAVLVKGGHLPRGSGAVSDVFVDGDGAVRWLPSEPLEGEGLRGKGCILASHAAALMGNGLGVADAVVEAQRLTARRLALESRQAATRRAAPLAERAYVEGFERIRATLSPACVPEVGMNVAFASPDVVGLAGRITIAGDAFDVTGLPVLDGPHHTGRIAATLANRTGTAWWVLNHRFAPDVVDAAARAGLAPVRLDRVDEPRDAPTMEWATEKAFDASGTSLRVYYDEGMPGKEAMVRLVAPSAHALAEVHDAMHDARAAAGRGGGSPSRAARDALS